jgi:thiol-disulfide isomerase/thioredoxin
MKKIVFLFPIILLLFIACGGDGEDGSEPPNVKVTSIKINASMLEVEVGETISFTVTGNEGTDLTRQAQIFINGLKTDKTTFTPTEKGNVTVSATYNSISSNSLIIKVLPKTVTSIKVMSDNNWVDLNHEFTFKVFDSNNDEITAQATIFVDNSEIEGNKFQPSIYGTYGVIAKFQDFTSESIIVEAKQYATNFTKKVLIEDFTGTWCGWCPRVSYAIELVEKATENAVITAIHRGKGEDPYHFDEANIGNLDEGYYPRAKLNRKTTWNSPEPSNVNQVIDLTNSTTNLGLGIDSKIIGNKIDLEISIGFLKSFDNLKFVVYLLEDNLIYNQANYTEYYNGPNNLTNFEHNNVLRKVVTNLFGDTIPNEFMITNGVFKKSFNIDIPNSIKDTSALTVVAFVLDATGKVVNTQKAEINSYKNFD